MKSFNVMAALLIAVESVKKLLFCFSALTLLFVVASCSNESDLEGFSQESKVLSLANAKKLKNTVDSFNKTCYSYIYTGKSRAVSCGASDSIILIGDEKDVLEKNERILLDASYDFFSEIGLTKEKIIREIGNGNEEAVIYAGLIAMSSILDNDSSSTRAITGNVYIDCALSVIGLDLATSVRTAIEKGVSKKIALQLVKQAVKTTLGATYGAVVTVGLWGLCVGGIG